MSYEREAAHTVLLMVTPDWWTALEGIVRPKLKSSVFHPHFISNLYNFFSCVEQKMRCFEECSVCSLVSSLQKQISILE